ncbi:MAG: spermidine synthase [Roseimicrobium sp.]
MKPFVTLATARTPDGDELSLHEHDEQFYLRVNRQPLMGTNATESERVMARLACEGFHRLPKSRVLIGGLGFGFTLREVLAQVGVRGVVQVAELLPEVVAWNREFLGHVNGKLLDDPRVRILIGDVFQHLGHAEAASYDAILLDVDNGPVAMVRDGNARLYEQGGLATVLRALKPGGIAAYWSASPDKKFAKRLTNAGFKVEEFAAKAHERARRPSHTIFLARKGSL